MATVTKKDLVDRVAAITGENRLIVKEVLQALLDQVVFEIAAGHRIEFRDFGVFEVQKRAPRIAQNPKTRERVEVPEKRTVKFKAGRLMKESLDARPPAATSIGAPRGAAQPETLARRAKQNGHVPRHR